MTKIGRVAIALSGLVMTALVPALSAPSHGSHIVSLRRLTESEYRNSIADIFGGKIDVQGRFEPERRVGGLLATSTTILSVTPSGFEGYSKLADNIAAQVVDESHRASLLSCTPKSAAAADDKCASQVLAYYGERLFRRPLTREQLNLRVTLAARTAKASGNFYTGLSYGLSSLLSAPEFLFRVETAVPTGKDYTLDGYSRAARLSYLFWNTTPDAELLAAAGKGELDTSAGIERQVDRLMASPRLETGMRAFFADFLELDTIANITKDPSAYPKFNEAVASAAKEEALLTAIDLTLRRDGDVRDLMTARRTFINRTLASVYGIAYDFDADWVPYDFGDSDGRSGLLTSTALLGMFSHPGRSSPTKRGVAVLDIFLCEPTPNPPANVDFSVVNDVSNPKLKTVRDRLMAHATNPSCASCHTHSDPIGLSLEQFDSIGARRDRENGDLIDVSATLSGQKFSGATGLGKVLHDNPKFPACFARKVYSYGSGASSEDMPATQYRAALDSFKAGGYRLKTLLKAVATDPQFFSAPPPEEAVKTAAKD